MSTGGVVEIAQNFFIIYYKVLDYFCVDDGDQQLI